MKTFSTSGTGNQQTLSEIESDKIPIYDSVADAEADLANLADGQFGATADTGSELSAPTDTVQSGNMHAVTSNAVARYCTEIESVTISETASHKISFLRLGKIVILYFLTSTSENIDLSNYFTTKQNEIFKGGIFWNSSCVGEASVTNSTLSLSTNGTGNGTLVIFIE